MKNANLIYARVYNRYNISTNKRRIYDSKTHIQNSEIISKQLLIDALLTDENLDVLKEEEYDLLWFIIVVIYGSIKKGIGGELPVLSKEIYQKWEESNWKVWNEAKVKDFRSKLNPFFEGYPQEDLLAFVEDSLESDEDLEVNPIAQEISFILAKSIIDTINHMVK